MPLVISQSSISEVRDQLCLDYADGNYLNVVSVNLGITRPVFGFTDATWRALVKALSLQYKQVITKFEQVLNIMVGPKVTQCSSFAEDCIAGEYTAILVGATQFPQVGTMVLDEGLATEETIEYEYIDQYTNTVYFSTPLQFAHTAINAEWETGVINPAPATFTQCAVFDAAGLPDPLTTGVQYTAVIGRGTPYEYSDIVTGVSSLPSRTVKLGNGSTIDNPGVSTASGSMATLSATATQENAVQLTLLTVDQLPEESGYLQGEVGTPFTTFTTSTTTSAIVSAGTLTIDAYVGFYVRFDGNVTAALAGEVAQISANTASKFEFVSALPGTPDTNDTFTLLANFQYIRASVDDTSVLMRTELPDFLTFAASTKFSVLKPSTTLSIAQVQVKAGRWDIFQSDVNHVEILLPEDLLANDVRTASYVRSVNLVSEAPDGESVCSTTHAAGLSTVLVTTTAALPAIGVVEHAAANLRYAYHIPASTTTVEAQVGDTVLTVLDTSVFPFTGGTLLLGGTAVGAYTVLSTTTLGVPALAFEANRGMKVKDETLVILNKPLESTITLGDTLNWYAHYSSGDIWGVNDDVWPGPYMWDYFEQVSKKETVPGNTLTTMVSGPVKLAVDSIFGSSVLEVEDASAFPTTVPFSLRLGDNSGNVETLEVQEVALRQRTHSTLDADANPGDLTLTLASLTGPSGGAYSTFPNARPYRVLLCTSPSVAEVVEVISTTGLATLNLATPVVGSFSIGTKVLLLADLVVVSPTTADDHLGITPYASRFQFYPPLTQHAVADLARPLYTSGTLTTASADFPATASMATFNFGSAMLPSKTTAATAEAGTTKIICADATTWPASGFPDVVTIGASRGPLYTERVHVTGHIAFANILTISHKLIWDHDTYADSVEFQPGPEENISYTSRSGTVFTFSPYLDIDNTHQSAEYLSPTVGTGYPRTTGFDFPVRMPITTVDRIKLMIDMVRAAGILVTYITRR